MGRMLHRDLEAGIIAGKLEKEGFYGTEIQLEGFVYGDQAKVCIVEDEMEAAVSAYSAYLQGTSISAITSHSQRIYGDEATVAKEKEQFIERFSAELRNSIGENDMIAGGQALYDQKNIERGTVAHSLSGFVFIDGERPKVMANAYFPQTFKWWVEKKLSGVGVSDIVIRARDLSESPAKQLKKFKDDLLKTGK